MLSNDGAAHICMPKGCNPKQEHNIKTTVLDYFYQTVSPVSDNWNTVEPTSARSLFWKGVIKPLAIVSITTWLNHRILSCWFIFVGRKELFLSRKLLSIDTLTGQSCLSRYSTDITANPAVLVPLWSSFSVTLLILFASLSLSLSLIYLFIPSCPSCPPPSPTFPLAGFIRSLVPVAHAFSHCFSLCSSGSWVSVFVLFEARIEEEFGSKPASVRWGLRDSLCVVFLYALKSTTILHHRCACPDHNLIYIICLFLSINTNIIVTS